MFMIDFTQTRMTRFVTCCLLATLPVGCSDFLFSPDETKPDGSSIPWSQIEGRIAFTYQSRVDGEGYVHGIALYEMDGHEQRLRKIKEWRKRNIDMLGLDWSISGTRIVFALWRDGPGQLFQINRDGSDQSELYPDPEASHRFPVWSSDGRLAYLFHGFREGELHADEIFVDNEPFVNCETLGGVQCLDTRPSWSPDGQFIVISMMDSTYQGNLYRVSVENGLATLLHRGMGMTQELFYYPIYSPIGDRIAFMRSTTIEGSQIWVMDSDGKNAQQVTNGTFDRFPVWSPDGTKILFDRFPGDSTEGSGIHLIDSDGSGLTLVTPDHGFYFSWTR